MASLLSYVCGHARDHAYDVSMRLPEPQIVSADRTQPFESGCTATSRLSNADGDLPLFPLNFLEGENENEKKIHHHRVVSACEVHCLFNLSTTIVLQVHLFKLPTTIVL